MIVEAWRENGQLLGDFPLIGQFFRSSTNSQKNELVIIVTPSHFG